MCPLCPWLQLKNGKGCLYMHLVRHHGPERRFVSSGTKQLRAVMALHQCDLFRGRRPADYLARSAELIRCSVGPLSCTRLLRVDREYRVLLTASGPRFVCKDIGSGAVAARRVGNVFHDRGFADIFLGHLMQTGRSHAHDDEPFAVRPVAEVIVRSPDVSAWKSALYHGLRSSESFHVPSVDGTMGVLRRDAGTPVTPGGSQQNHVDHNTCVLITRTLQSAVLDLASVPSDSKLHVVVSALENAVPDDRVGVHWVVVDNAPAFRGRFRLFGASRWTRAISRFSGLQDAPSACQQVQRVRPFGGLPGSGRT